MKYEALTEETAIAYARDNTDVFAAGAKLSCKEIGDGNLNMVFRVVDEAGGTSVIVKQSLPYARIDDSIKAPLERATIESEMLILHDRNCPGLAPKIHYYDRDMYAIVMEDLSDHVVLRKGLIAGTKYPRLAEDIGTFLARSLFFTSDLGMDPQEKKLLTKQFINPELCKITEDLIFSNPYFDADNNKIDPEIRERAEQNWKDDELKKQVAILKEMFMTRQQALVHGDLHTGSVFVTESSTKAFDPEFAFFGPIGFDVGLFLGNMLLNHASQRWHIGDADARASYRAWLMEVFAGVWTTFDRLFRQLWTEHVTTPMESSASYRDDYMQRVFADSIGYAGTVITRRIVGLAQVEDIRSIPDAAVRAEVQIAALDTAREFILRRHEFTSIDEVVAVIDRLSV